MKRMVDKAEELQKFGEVIKTENGETTIGHSVEVDGSLRVNGYVGENVFFTKGADTTEILSNSTVLLGNIYFVELHIKLVEYTTSRIYNLGQIDGFNSSRLHHVVMINQNGATTVGTIRADGTILCNVSSSASSELMLHVTIVI